MEIDLSQFHQVFFEESFEGLDVMEQELLNLEEDSDLENVNTIFRAAHSIKGGSATFNFKDVADFTHVMETLLDEMREGSRPVTREIIDLLLKSVDCLRGMLNKIQDDEPVGEAHCELINSFNLLLSGEAIVETEVNTAAEQAVETQPIAADTTEDLHHYWNIQFIPQSHILETGNEPVRMFRELKGMGVLESTVDVSKVPDFDELVPESCFLSWRLRLDADTEYDTIKEVFEWVEDECELTIDNAEEPEVKKQDVKKQEVEKQGPITESEISVDTVISDKEVTAVETDDIEVSGAEKTTGDSSSDKMESTNAIVSISGAVSNKTSDVAKEKSQKLATETQNSSQAKVKSTAVNEEKKNQKKATSTASIRVGIDKVDTLIDLVGELVITQSMLSELGDNFTMAKLNQLVSGLSELEQNTRELQESVMRIRMLPIGFVFNRLPRMVRDLSSQLGKKVHLAIKGESTELDKTVMEQIGDPLTHLVRNALDHGLESTEQRIAAGKSEEGTVTLNAFHQGGNIVIEVSDNGGGIDPDVIYDKAVEKGMIQQGEELVKEQILGLIMEPGFSTAAVVSDVSGRGVGMDVVKRNINNLGGSVEIESNLGKGTTFTIRLPLTLAILDGQLIRVANEVYVLPLVSIIESIPLSMVEISKIAGDMKVYKLHNEYVPIIDLREEFVIQRGGGANSEGLLAIVEGENRKIALKIDDLMGQQQVVIKSLDSHYKSIQGVSGATILGDGRVSLILDIVGLAKRAAIRANHRREKVA